MAFRIGIVGLGTVHRTHLQALRQLPQVEPAVFCDIDPAKRPEQGIFYTDYREMAERERLDAVHICLPHHLHSDGAEVFARHGVSVLCEKPVARDLDQWQQMCRLEETYGVKVAVCLQNRLNRSFTALKEQLADGSAGRLLGIKAVATWCRTPEYYAAAPWRGRMDQAGGGCMINQAIHTLDLMLQVGGEVRSVSGQTSRLSGYPIEVEDTAAARISFANGTAGLFLGSVCNADNSSIELRVTCERKIYTIKDYALWVSSPEAEWEKRLLIRDEQMTGAKTYYGAGHVQLIRNFYQMLSGRPVDYVSVQDAGTVLRLITGICRSSEEGRCIKWEEIQ